MKDHTLNKTQNELGRNANERIGITAEKTDKHPSPRSNAVKYQHLKRHKNNRTCLKSSIKEAYYRFYCTPDLNLVTPNKDALGKKAILKRKKK